MLINHIYYPQQPNKEFLRNVCYSNKTKDLMLILLQDKIMLLKNFTLKDRYRIIQANPLHQINLLTNIYLERKLRLQSYHYYDIKKLTFLQFDYQ